MSSGNAKVVAGTPPREVQGNARRLSADSPFTQLPAPVYEISPSAIRTGSERTLAVVGGTLLAVSAFGAWHRVTEITTVGSDPAVTDTVLGIDLGTGVVVTLLAVAAVGLNGAWQRSQRVHLLAVVITSLAAIAGFVQLLLVQSQIGDRAIQAVASPDFVDRNLGLGWGAWAGLVGSCLLVLAVLFGVLLRREGSVPASPAPSNPGALR